MKTLTSTLVPFMLREHEDLTTFPGNTFPKECPPAGGPRGKVKRSPVTRIHPLQKTTWNL